jgi:hypothetical protein
MIAPCAHILRSLALLAVIGALFCLPARALDWLPVTDEDRDATASTIDPEAGAEILHRVRQIDDSRSHGITEEYIRIKVYNEKGVRQLSKIDVPYDNKNERIRSIEARVIKPDGTIINVDKKDFYDREIIKYGNLRLRVRSFSFPLIEPGVIVEYKWRRTSRDNIFMLKLDFMDDLPSRRVLFRIKAHDLGPGTATMGHFYLCGEQKIAQGKDGFSFIELRDLKASTVEPFMPPVSSVQPWMAFYPTFGSASLYWSFVSHGFSAIVTEKTKKDSKLVRETAAKITQGLAMPGERIAAINDYCRTQIKNTDHDTTPGADESRERSRKLRGPDDVIKNKSGGTLEVGVLFIALAKSLGIEARLALCARRSNGPFLMGMPSVGLLPDLLIASHYMEEWHFFDPSRREVDTGMLRWENEQQNAFVVLGRGYRWIITPKSPVEKSATKRTAKLQLDNEGTLTGNVHIEYSGHAAVDARERFQTEMQSRLEEKVRELVQARLPGAEVDNVTVSRREDFMKPFVLGYSVRVAGYAERAGQRLFIQPGFFTKGQPPLFSATTRAYDVCFNYATLAEDDVSIKMPPGYNIEQGSAPATVNRVSWGRHDIQISHSRKRGEIYYKRFFEFLPVQIAAEKYPEVKNTFDLTHLRDSHTLTLRSEKENES